jgi:hypothetical protein
MFHRDRCGIVKRYSLLLLTPAPGRVFSTGMVHEYVSHGFRRDTEEVRPVCPSAARSIRDSQIRFMDKSSCLQRVRGTLSSHVAGSDTPQLRIDKRHEALNRGLVSLAPLDQ